MNKDPGFSDMAAFVCAVEQGSFARAAEELGLSPSALSKLVSRLEGRLGARLLTRTTRRLALTPEGEIYLTRARDILQRLEQAEEEIAASAGAPRGLLTINTGTAFGSSQLGSLLADFSALYPAIHLRVGITDRQVDVIAEQVDVAIRVGAMRDSSLVARKIMEGRRLVCGSPAYFARHGRPHVPSDLAQHNCLLLERFAHEPSWPFQTPRGVERVSVKGSAIVDSAVVLRAMAEAGIGLVRLGNDLVMPAIRAGLLESVLEDCHSSEAMPHWAVMAPGRNRLPRVRVFVDFLVERFRDGVWR